MASITTRAGKGTALTHAEVDANFTNLNTAKLEAGAVTSSGLTMATARLLGRSTASTGAVEEITVGTGLSLAAGQLSATGGAGISDGDKGDITVSGSGATWTIDSGVVGTTKLGGDITTAGKALLDDADAAAQRTTLGLGTLATQSGTFSGTSSGTNTGDQTITLTGNVTGSGTGSFATTIANDAVTYAKIQNVSATDRLLGRSSAGSGDVEEITCTAAGRALLDDADAAAQRTTLGLGSIATLAAPSGTVVGTTDTQTLTNKTLTDPAITGTILEDVFTITDGAAFEVDPGNGSVQLITLGASRTPKATNFAAGESVTLMVDDGTAYTLTWTDSTWGTGGVTWVGGSPPTLATSGYSVMQFWKVGTKVYGASVGNVA